MYYGNRIICPACGMVSADEDYCTECGEVFSQYDNDQLKREGRRWFGIVDAVDVDRYECQYCGITISERVYNPNEMTIEYEHMICPACGAMMMPIYKKNRRIMKITFSNNASSIGCGVETNRDEIGGKKELKNLAENFSDSMTRAYDAAKMVWEKFPEFRQITLDTMTDEDRQIIDEMEKKGGARC